jgi:hypothetical protein
MSNRGRLIDAGIIDPERTLTDDQREAIESLSEDEVDQLIAVNDHLAEEIPTEEDEPPVLEMPGRNPNPSNPNPSYKKKS